MASRGSTHRSSISTRQSLPAPTATPSPSRFPCLSCPYHSPSPSLPNFRHCLRRRGCSCCSALCGAHLCPPAILDAHPPPPSPAAAHARPAGASPETIHNCVGKETLSTILLFEDERVCEMSKNSICTLVSLHGSFRYFVIPKSKIWYHQDGIRQGRSRFKVRKDDVSVTAVAHKIACFPRC